MPISQPTYLPAGFSLSDKLGYSLKKNSSQVTMQKFENIWLYVIKFVKLCVTRHRNIIMTPMCSTTFNMSNT